ncbi:hypothetical protein THF1D04_20003 [Vibrio owensii]|uniref:Uncharacterized protein n=1 Tax=Vibrio owensii TaxID=696485 RepID=A0AAU9Q3Z0_9VIBR|nr:hypothetical protein THF1D04_20003 [Vibrio owensii]
MLCDAFALFLFELIFIHFILMKNHNPDLYMSDSAIGYRLKMPNNLFHEYTTMNKRSSKQQI